MNSREVNFAYKVRHALNEDLASLPGPTALRLASAREAAVARKRKSPLRALASRGVLSMAGGTGGRIHSWLGAAAAALPTLALVWGLSAIYQHEQQRRISDTAEMDAEMLADELPLSAYTDNGFGAFLEKQGD